ncbi:hypothetical protein [uncultured Croceitalea sp.]|uniref:hypothetical protein n=1 Tax=uncultured Croceitalea sp. TaxID=1798908 RepID=UPI00330660F1
MRAPLVMNTLKALFFLVSLAILICSCSVPNNSNGGWQKVFKNDENGKAIFGNKEQLIDAVRLGYPVRIGWGSSRVEHVANADFLTIFDGEVFGQIKSIVGQAPTNEHGTPKIRFRAENNWTKISGTNGYSTAFMTNYLKDTIISGNVDRKNATTWYVYFPAKVSEIKPLPLLKNPNK